MSTLTKIFIVLQLVFSLALSVLVIMVVSSQPKYKDLVEAEAKKSLAAQAALASYVDQNGKLLANNASLSQQLADAQIALKTRLSESSTRIAALEKDKANLEAQIAEAGANYSKSTEVIKSLKDQYTAINDELNKARDENRKVTNRSAELVRENERLSSERDQLTRALRRAQEEVYALNDALSQKGTSSTGGNQGQGQGGSVAYGALSPAAKPINGSISRVDSRDGKTYFSLPLGRRDGLSNGMTVIVSRNNGYVGDAEVVNAQVDQSVAVVKVLNRGQQVQTGDTVTVSH